MSVTTDSWLQDVSIAVPGAPKVQILGSVIKTVRDFCQATLLWVKKLDVIDVVANTATYTLTCPASMIILGVPQASVVNIDRAEFQDSPMGPESMDVLDRSPIPWRQEESSQSDAYMVDAEKVLRLRYIPTENIPGALAIWAALKPTVLASTVPDFLYDEWYDCIRNGTIADLFQIPRQVYTNIQEAEYFNVQYHEDLSKAKAQKTTGKAKVKTRVQPAPFDIT